MTALDRWMNKPIIITISLLLLTVSNLHATEKATLTGEKNRTSYSIGYQIGEDLKKQKVGLDSDGFLKGVEDALSGNAPEFTGKEMQVTLAELKKKINAQYKTAKIEKQKDAKAGREQYRTEGLFFLAANAKKEGVVTLPSGLQYKVITAGTGKKPGPKDTVLAHYKGSLTDGTEFQNTRRKGIPARLLVSAVVPGMREALPLMAEGSVWQLFVPGHLAYGEKGPLADRTVIFEIELISVEALK